MAGGLSHEIASGIGKDQIGVSDAYNVIELQASVKEFGFEFLYLPTTASTMTTIRETALRGSLGPAIALANHQTSGVGREASKKWHDNPGSSILFSALIPLQEDPIAEFADLVALRVCLALRKTGADFRVKAPNDIVDAGTGKKVSGILVQNMYDETNRYIGTNVGVGVNVHYTAEQLAKFPTEYGATAVDIANVKFNERQALFEGMLEGIATVGPEAIAMINGDNQSVRDFQNMQWQEHAYLLGREVQVIEGDKTTEGKVCHTEIGQGIVLLGRNGQKTPIGTFNTDTKVRVTA